MDVKVIIGANYGGEGKGCMADFFCHDMISKGLKCCTVLTNGGPQRNHTVSTSDGKEFVFHHLGSGMLAGADTTFSDEFLINPMILRSDFENLSNIYTLKKYQNIILNQNCRLITPFDIIANQIIAQHNNSQNTCGMGIYETIRRNKQIPLLVRDVIGNTSSQI